MEQDYYLSPEEEKNEQSYEESTKSKKLDSHVYIFVLQGIVCVTVIIICVVIKYFFGDFFGEIKTWYDKNMNEDTNVSLVIENSSELSGSGGPFEEFDIDLTKGFELPVSGVYTSKYGYRTDPFTGKTATHSGVDIAAEQGTDIRAAMSGLVELSKKSDGDYGNYIIINHGGFKTLYAHCEKLFANVGEFVSAGEVIATVGNTGRSTGPHLHFEIRIGDTRIDPTPFIKTENQ